MSEFLPENLKLIIRNIGIENWAFVNQILVAELCLNTARIGPYHCGHRTRAVLSSDKHWYAVLEHCLALLSVLSLAAVVSWSLTCVTAKHCLITQSLLP